MAARRRGGKPKQRQAPWVVLTAAASVVSLVTAIIVHALVRNLPGGQVWGAFLAWLVAGIVAGAMVERRTRAISVAIVAALSAGMVTAIIGLLEPTDPDHTQAADRMMLMTLACGMTCVLGAAGVSELRQHLDARRLRRAIEAARSQPEAPAAADSRQV